MSVSITKHFVTVGNRRVHYSRAGSGPSVCLFHPSPCSATRMRPQQQIFATRFTALAFDTPGFGLSDKLPLEKPELTDFADAFAETLTALGIKRTAVYGNHTGAAIAVEFAARHPERCAMALADGYPAYSSGAAEDRLKRYLEPIVPKWDGSHLLWLWYRYREQHVFWPWHDHDLAHRADTDVPNADFIHQGVIDLLDAGDDYRIGYAAAFRGRGLSVLPDLKVPVCFTLRPGDSLHRTKPMYAGTNAWLEETPRDALAATVREMELLSRHLGDVPPEAPKCGMIINRSTTDYVHLEFGGGNLLLRSRGDLSTGVPLLMLHDVPGSSVQLEPMLTQLGRSRPVLAIDLPGQGQSDAETDLIDAAGVDLWVAGVRAMLQELGLNRVDVLGLAGGCTVAVELASVAPQMIRRLALVAPPCFDARERDTLALSYAPVADPQMDGTHLLRVWHQLRDQELWWPWFDRRRENARQGNLRLDPADMTVRVREMLKNPSGYAPSWQAVLDYPLRERLAALTRCPTLLLTAKEDLFAHCLPCAAALMPHASVVEVEDSDAARAAAIEGFLSA